MPGLGLSFTMRVTGVTFEKLARFTPDFRRNLMVSLQTFGYETETILKNVMKSGSRFAANSSPWAAAKGGKPPLYNTGYLATLPSSWVIPGKGEVFASVAVGIPEGTGNHPDSNVSIYTLVRNLRRGVTWTPTPAQRRAFWRKVPDEFKNSTSFEHKEQWTIPPRDFLALVSRNAVVRQMFRVSVRRAIALTLFEKGVQ